MAYDAEDTRRRIFDAAAAEFAARGLAGARIDRIASAARANKQAIYLYYGGKDQLFGAVVRAKLEDVRLSVPVDPDAVTESVGQLFDWYREHPELIRLVLWEALEAGDGDGEDERRRREGARAKTRHLADVGFLRHLPEDARVRAAQDLVFTVIGMIAWNFAVPATCRIVLDEDTDEAALDRRRASVIDAVRRLVTAPDAPDAPDAGNGAAGPDTA